MKELGGCIHLTKHYNQGKNNHNYGKHHSEETKQKISLAQIGKKVSEETKEKQRLAHLGHKPSSETLQKISLAKKGKKLNLSEEARQKMRLAQSGEKNNLWKGDNVKYIALHEYVKRHFPPTEVCDNCRENKKLDLANITGDYKRDFINWKYLCRSCHKIFDHKRKRENQL